MLSLLKRLGYAQEMKIGFLINYHYDYDIIYPHLYFDSFSVSCFYIIACVNIP